MSDSDSNRPSKEEMRSRIKRIREGIRITKITATRSIKARNGDTFVGFSAAWQSVQDDAGGMGADVQGDPEEDAVAASQGLTLKDARVARLMLAMECDLAALDSAMANGGISTSQFSDHSSAVRSNYHRLIQRELGGSQDDVK